MSIEIKGFEEFERKMQKLLDDYPKRKLRLAKKIGYILERNVKKLTPVDYGRLRSSITSKATENRAEVGTNVYYAKWVEEGHVQKPHFVPGEFLQNGGNTKFSYDPDKYNPNAESPDKLGGIFLKRKFIKGKFMFKKGLEKSEPQIQQEIEKFMEKTMEGLK